MNRKILSVLMLTGILMTLVVVPVLAYTQDEIDQMTGPATGVSNTYTADGVKGLPSSQDGDVELGIRGDYIGSFKATAYCSCSRCCGSNAGGKTYSGTYPKANHTLSADIAKFPIGTRLMIGDSPIVYTVEDKGSAVVGNKIDIFMGSHEEAYAYGTQTVELYYAQ